MGIYVGENPLSVPGMSAYQEAIKGGFAGTREDFDKALNNLPDHLVDKVRHVTAEERTSWNGKAPGGFGLGGTAKLLTADDDLNNVLTTGWYIWGWNAHPKNAPDNNWREYGRAMHVFATTPGGYAIQTVYDLSDDITHGCAIQRTIYVLSSGNIYYPWEWVNPPMQLGVEYRTTERYLGKPVYTKVINFGPSPNNGIKNVKLGVSNVNKICGASFHYYVPSTGENGIMVSHTQYTTFLVSNDVVQIKTNTDKTDTNFYVTIKYTKTTD